jgi:hypothetical protein
MVSMAIKDKHSICFYYMAIYMRNEVINELIYINLICCLSIITDINFLIIWKSLKPAFL